MDEQGVRQIAGKLGIRISGRSRDWLHAKCPLSPWTHQSGRDNSPSFGLRINENGVSAYKCLGCGYHGRLSGLARVLGRFMDEDFTEVARQADRLDLLVELPEFEASVGAVEAPTPLGPEYQNLFDVLNPVSNREACRYLLSRGISRATADLLGLAYDPEECRIVFPVRHTDGQLYGFTGRTVLPGGETPYGYPTNKKYPKVRDYYGLKKRFFLLGAELVQPGKPLLVVEGLFGYAHLVEIGARDVCNPVALMGSEMTAEKASLIMSIGEPAYLLTDNDAAGDKCLWGTWVPEQKRYAGGGAVDQLAREVPLFIPEWPEGKDDPDQLSREEVINMVSSTPLFLDF